ncbi:guanine nucleotide-binding protein subunit gamma [Rhinocladiella mackenziei CBS 650.93]|uniref:Guanine nucleotide-binding protein subunit gamma n=1 Tax=Rhinocladiella mackenziei CBS 650.93 TaxID=1442369 RepID=A0A0D2FID8_9EURO|nr:guanine nucleotide-binding protein subunit gamma [Rhinocladiella mackenziei CBS 650.93]KIX01792.1 guanine nucleotide-binding protein subunit gamma [Rhinocladiella mackenziei CBS 650.93]
MPAVYAVRDGGDAKSKKQSMADLKLRRLQELNSRLKEDLERPRVKVAEASMSLINYCNQTRDYMVPSVWGQYAQELLQTFGTSIGEIALIPVTGGIFAITMTHPVKNIPESSPPRVGSAESSIAVQDTLLWDRKTNGGFPETKELKSKVRNIIEPDRDLGHIDRSLKKNKTGEPKGEEETNWKDDSATVQKDGDRNIQQSRRGDRESGIQRRPCEDCE